MKLLTVLIVGAVITGVIDSLMGIKLHDYEHYGYFFEAIHKAVYMGWGSVLYHYGNKM